VCLPLDGGVAPDSGAPAADASGVDAGLLADAEEVPPDAGAADVGADAAPHDAALDAASTPPDAGAADVGADAAPHDAAVDAASTPPDGSVDASIDASAASLDASTDASFDASADAGMPDSQLLAYWTFDEVSGATAYDSSGNGNDLTLSAGVLRTTAGHLAGAIQGDGVSGIASVPLDLAGTSGVTVSFWAMDVFPATSFSVFFEFSDNYNHVNDGFVFFPSTDGIECNYPSRMEIGLQGNSGYSVVCYSQPTSSQWHHYVVVYDKSLAAGSEVTLYVGNDAPVVGNPGYTNDNTNKFGSYSLYLLARHATDGNGLPGSFSAAFIDEMKVFGKAFSQQEVGSLFP
jgi:hypothetical protein